MTALAGPMVALEADASMTAEAGRLRLVLHVKNGNSVGERVLDGDSCVDLAESAAVILAMSGMSTAVEVPPPVAPPPPPPPAPVVQPEAPPAPPAVTPGPRAPFVRVTPVVAFDIGTLPSPAFGGGLAVDAVPGRGFTAGLAGALWGTNAGTATGLALGQGANFDLITANANGCYSVLRGKLELSPCVVLEFDYVSATGFRTGYNRTGTANWLSVGAGARLRWQPTRHFGVALDVDGIVPTVHQPFAILVTAGSVKTLDNVHVTGPIAVRAYLGPEVRF